MTGGIDLSLPLATLLKSETSDAHETTENSPGAAWLTGGKLDKEEYTRFLIMLWYIYGSLERALESHSSHPTISPTYNPTLLARAPSLASDISYLLQTHESSWMSHSVCQALRNSPPPALVAYTSRIKAISDSSDPSALLAHAYVRYLGDLSGGQIIRRRVAKAYGLDLDDGLGIKFYDFKQLGGTKTGVIGDLRKIKEWYRDALNQGVGDDPNKKLAIIEEAKRAFFLNAELLATLHPPSSATSESTRSAFPSPERSSFITSKQHRSLVELGFSLSAVLSFVLVISLAHFTLFMTGSNGRSGYGKMQTWVDTTLSLHGLLHP